jgi:galactose mutarotase-like enzyme
MLTLLNKSCQIQLSPQRGGIVTSLKIEETEALYLDQATFDDPNRNVRGGIPVLFPLCGPQAEPAIMNQHGFARTLEWQVEGQQPDRARLVLKDSEATRAVYPYQFTYELTYSALPNGLKIAQVVTNNGDRPMPLQFGFHPYFLVGDKAQLEFELPVSTYDDNKSDDSGVFQGFDFERDEIDWAFPNPTALRASFRDPERRLEVNVSYGPEYTQLVFWTLKEKPYVCVEPWSSARFAYPDGEDVQRIQAGGRLSTGVELTFSLS